VLSRSTIPELDQLTLTVALHEATPAPVVT